jgi:hypothetical protein
MLALPPVALRVSSIVMSSAPDRLPGTRRRDGGKAPASKLLRRVDPHSKRGRVLAFFLPGASVADAMSQFTMTRPAIFTTFTTLHKEHGVGYDANGGAITIRLPKGATPEGGLWL